MSYHAQLLVSSDVKEPAGGVVGSRCKRVSVREELWNLGKMRLINHKGQQIQIRSDQ